MGVATAIAVGGLALSAGSTAMSFVQAGEQKDKQRQAEAAAAAAMAEARKKLEINYTDELAVKKEPYELQREAFLSQGAQAIEAGQESDRGSATTAGKVLMAQNEAQAGIRTAMGNEMTDIQNKQIQEQSRLRDLGVQLDLGEVEGQQMIAQNAEQASTAATAQGMQGLVSTAQQGLNMMPLYFKDSGNKVDLSTATQTGTNGPGANPAFQSKASDRFTNPTTMSTYQSQNPQPGTQYGVFGTNYGQTIPLQQGVNAFQPSMFSGVGSDRKLKKNITKIGESPSGLNIYSFEYIDQTKFGEGIFQGAMSDEVPNNAVVKGSDGFDRVNYSLLDIEFKKI